MILLIDNYDSFTYNIMQYIQQLEYECKVVRNDAITLDEIAQMKPAGIVLSPGPGTPDSAGITLQVIDRFAGEIPILGVCLGHQAIGQAFGGKVIRAPKPKHGKLSDVVHDGEGVFKHLVSPMRVARYHSLVVEKETFPYALEITATSEDGLIMGLQHRTMNIHGVQFHPESIATEGGLDLIQNFLVSTC